MAADKFQRMVRNMPSFYKSETNTMIRGLLKAWAVSDDEIEIQLKNTKDQLFVQTAEGRNLDRLGSNVGVDRAPELGIDDSDFQELIPVLSFFPKQVRKTVIALLDVFWGPGFTRPNINSGNTETYNFGPSSLAGGTAIFKKDSKTIKGTGTTFTTSIIPGNYIKPSGTTGDNYQKVSAVIDDTTLVLSLPWKNNTAVGAIVEIGVTRELEYSADGKEATIIRFIPNAFQNLTAVTIQEIIDFINSQAEHNVSIAASKFLDPIVGPKLNLRTNTPGLQGSIQILGGDANDPTRLNFSTNEESDTRAKVIETNPNEVVVQIPSSVPVLRRNLSGSVHPRQTKTAITSDQEVFDFSGLGASSTLEITIDSSPYTITFTHATDFANSAAATSEEVAKQVNDQLTFLQARTSCTEGDIKRVELRTTEGSSQYQVTGGTANGILNFDTALQQDPDLIDIGFPSSYIFDPIGQLFTVTKVNSELAVAISAGSVQASITLNDASIFSNLPGNLLFDFGRSTQEGPVSYTSRPNNSTLLIDASHIFQNDHGIGRKVNFISNNATIPRLTGEDYPVYITGTEEARVAAQGLIRQLLAAGVVIRFLIDFPEFLFECTCRGCGPSEDPNQRGSLTGQGPLVF